MSDMILYYQLFLYGGIIGIILGFLIYIVLCTIEYKQDSEYVKELRKQLNQNNYGKENE